jgi:hypothetical protein
MKVQSTIMPASRFHHGPEAFPRMNIEKHGDTFQSVSMTVNDPITGCDRLFTVRRL